MLHRGLDPASVLRLAFQSDTLPTDLSLPTAETFRKTAGGAESVKPVLNWANFSSPTSLGLIVEPEKGSANLVGS